MERIAAAVLCLLLAAGPASAAGPGDVPPELTVASLTTGVPRLRELRGKVVLVDFWASWCGPCRHSLPFFAELRSRHHDRGFEVLTISVDRDRSAAERALRDLSLPAAHDPEGVTPAAWGVTMMPQSFLIDRQGRIRRVHHGFRQSDIPAIEEGVIALLQERP